MAKINAKLDDEEPEAAAATDDAAAGAEGGGEGEKGFGAKKILIFVVAPLILLSAIGGGLYFSGMLDKFIGKGATETAEGEEGHGAVDEHGNPIAGPAAHFLQIPNMLVNLSSTEGQPRYLRLSVQLELASEEDMTKVQAVMPRVVDQFQTYLRELRLKDLRGSAGLYRLQMELLSRVNAAAYPVEVKDVLFQEILIQ